MKVVFLVNFLSPNLLEVMREVARRVDRLDILVSVPMEANRDWQVDFKDLPVITQRTWTKRKLARHPGGYTEELFVHIPLDTWSQLRRLAPDCIVSLEMGMRSLQSSLYRQVWNRRCRHVLAVYGSERSEAGRGRIRRSLRQRLLAGADVITYNGPSCERYLLGQGARPDRMLPWNYAADPHKAYRGPIKTPADTSTMKLLTVSQFIARKGVDRAARELYQFAEQHSEMKFEWAIAGTGPDRVLVEEIPRPGNMKLNLLGHCDVTQLQSLYAGYPINFFPTLGDEWGLVVDEALASGQLVLGSVHSQAVETLIRPGFNGWQFDPDQPTSLQAALSELIQLSPTQLATMREQARHSVANRTHIESAQQFVQAVERSGSC